MTKQEIQQQIKEIENYLYQNDYSMTDQEIKTVTLKIPITPSYPRDLSGTIDEPMASSIQSMVGLKPECRFGEDWLEIIYNEKDFNQIKEWYGRKWRSNITYEAKRHLKQNGLKGDFRALTVIEN